MKRGPLLRSFVTRGAARRVSSPPPRRVPYPLQVGSKFEYVVAVQTYGRNAISKDLRLRQLAQGVDTLMLR